jgi:uncharacterized protein YndB with AHSA1/START domain
MAFSFTVERLIDADPDTVFGVLADHRALAEITPLRRVEMTATGSPDPNGVGAVRELHLAGPPVVEEVTRFEPPTRMTYTIRGGLPVRDHLADVTLVPDGGRTHLTYRIEGSATLPGGDKPLELVLRGAVLAIVRGVQRRAERRPS